MNNLYQYVFISILSSGSVIAIATWLLKRYLGGRIDHMFKEREKILDHKLTSALKYEEKMVEVITEVVPKIQEVVHRSRNLIRELVNTRDRRILDILLNIWTSMSEYLYQYQLFVPEESFTKIHTYKNILHDLLLTPTTATGEINDAYPLEKGGNEKLSEQQIRTFKEVLPKINQLYEEIVNDLRELVDSRRSTSL